MFRIRGGRQQPRYLRQRIRLHVGFQLRDRARAHPACLQRRTGRRIHEVRETRQHVRAVVAGEIVEPGALLIDLPRDASLFEPLRVGLPAEGRQLDLVELVVDVVGVVEQRAAARAERIDHARHQVHAVRMRVAGDRAEVVVTHRERIRERVVERDIVADVIAHRHVRLLHRPLIRAAVVDRAVRRRPRMRQAADALRVDARVGRVVAERRNHARLVLLPRLEPHRLAVRQRDREAVVIAAHAAQVTEVVVERAVFLHEHDDVLDILDRARHGIRLDRQRLADRFGKQRGGGGRAGEAGRELQKIASRMGGHAGCS